MTARHEHRLRFANFEFTHLPSGHCHAKVDLDRPTGDVYSGTMEASGSSTVQLRCAALATLAALHKAVEARYSFELLDTTFELLGVKSVHAFDGTVVVVGVIASRGERTWQLIGACASDDSLPRAAALAVLDATNRFFADAPFPFAL
jgi:hypothetical protein